MRTADRGGRTYHAETEVKVQRPIAMQYYAEGGHAHLKRPKIALSYADRGIQGHARPKNLCKEKAMNSYVLQNRMNAWKIQHCF